MSMCYWGIVGHGVCIDDIHKYINKEKVNKLVRELNPDIDLKENEDVFEENVFYGDPYMNFAEFLCELDEDKIFTYDDDGNGRYFFMYAPSYPWRRKNNEPKTIDECEDKLIAVLHKVCNTTYETLFSKIKDISEWGCG